MKSASFEDLVAITDQDLEEVFSQDNNSIDSDLFEDLLGVVNYDAKSSITVLEDFNTSPISSLQKLKLEMVHM